MKKIELILKLSPFATEDARYKVAHGGRGSGKSWTVAALLVLKGAERKLRILCAREIQRSIKDSVHKLLSDTIDRLGLSDFYTIQHDKIVGKNGTTFFFCGLHKNVSQIKSFEGIDIAWVEEGENISKSSWNILVPTVRKEGSEIWVTFNPKRDEDFIYQYFVENTPPPRSIVIECNYYDNPFFPQVLEDERAHCEETDAELHDHVWLGKTEKHAFAQIFNGKWIVKEFDDPGEGVVCYYGNDWGFGANPSAFAKVWTIGGDLYIRVKHFHRADLEDLPELVRDAFPEADAWTWRADPEDPSSIRYFRNAGFTMKKASKPKGSVTAGIRYLRSFRKIYIHPEDTNMVEEARLYKYKTDPVTEEVLPIIIKAYDHGWDAVRYALSMLINRGTRRGATNGDD